MATFSKDAKPVNILIPVSKCHVSSSENQHYFSRARYSLILGFLFHAHHFGENKTCSHPIHVYNFIIIISVCLPDGTVQVTNPNVSVYSHVFAVQDEGVSAAVKCTVSTSGAQSNITGCSQVCKIQNNCYFFHGSINIMKP